MKRICWIIVALLALTLSAAIAENDCPLNCAYCRGKWDCPCCYRCTVQNQTARPAAVTCSAPTPQPSISDEPRSSSSTGDYTTLSSTAQEQKLLNLLNEDRARNGLPALSMDSELSALARTKSQDMLENGYFARRFFKQSGTPHHHDGPAVG